MYTFQSISQKETTTELMQYNNDIDMGTASNEAIELPKFNHFRYPQTPEPACKVFQKQAMHGEIIG